MESQRPRFSRQAAAGGLKIATLCFSLAALSISTGSMQAANLLAATTTPATNPALTCSTATGAGTAVTVLIKPVAALTGTNTITVSLGALPTGVSATTTPNSQVLNAANSAAGLTYVFNYSAGCAGASATVGAVASAIHFNAAANSGSAAADVAPAVSTTVTASATALVASPSPLTITCVKSGSSYTPAAAKTISVTSPAAGGTPFTIDNSVSPPAAWLSVGSASGASAGASPVTFTVQAASGCGAFASGSTNTTVIHLVNAPAPDKTISVSLQVVPPTPLTATPASPSLSYTKGSGTAGHVDVNVTSSPAAFFAVDTTTLPAWLTVDSLTGTTPKSIRFLTTNVSDTLAPGTYSTAVNLKVSGSGDLVVPISLLVTNPAPKLTVAEGTTRNITWTIGQPLPTPYITAVSSDSPISYSITLGGTLNPQVASNQLQGLAYSFGSSIAVTFDPLVFAAAQPSTVLTGTVTLKWGSPAATIVVTFNVTVQSPGATVTGISPASIPTAASGQVFTVVLSGTGFVPSTDPTQKTKVGIVVSGAVIPDTNIASNVVNASNMILTITVPVTADPYLPFSPTGNGGAVSLGVCNPAGGTCSVPTGTATLSIGNGPIIQAVTSASSYVQVSPGSTPSLAPYDMISIFGTNFCSSGGTGCSSSQVLYGTPDATLHYPSSVSPDPSGATQRSLTVRFQTNANPPVVLASAPILFATNNQINALVPSAVSAQIASNAAIVVSFGYGSGATMLNSAPFTVNVNATNPGVFTIGADGQGDAAALNSTDYSLVATGNEAGMRSTAADSDTVLLYLTGLGLPDSAADNSSSGSSAWSADCASIATYLTTFNALNSTSFTTADGLIIQSSALNTGRLSPCLTSGGTDVPSVTVGGSNAVVTYAGWVSGSIAGLYQINVRLPGSAASGGFTDANGNHVSTITQPVKLPIVVTANSLPSQVGVNLAVAPRLKVVAPSTTSGAVGVAFSASNNAFVASEGSGAYRYAITSGLLPAGLSLNPGTGVISGTPAANTAGTYLITVTATDYAAIPVSGTVNYTVTIAQGLYMSLTGSAPFTPGSAGSAYPSVTTITATGGIAPYTYSVGSTNPSTAGITVDPSSGVVSVSNAVTANTYHVTIHAVDSTGTPLTGNITFDITLN